MSAYKSGSIYIFTEEIRFGHDGSMAAAYYRWDGGWDRRRWPAYPLLRVEDKFQLPLW